MYNQLNIHTKNNNNRKKVSSKSEQSNHIQYAFSPMKKVSTYQILMMEYYYYLEIYILLILIIKVLQFKRKIEKIK